MYKYWSTWRFTAFRITKLKPMIYDMFGHKRLSHRLASHRQTEWNRSLFFKCFKTTEITNLECILKLNRTYQHIWPIIYERRALHDRWMEERMDMFVIMAVNVSKLHANSVFRIRSVQQTRAPSCCRTFHLSCCLIMHISKLELPG